MATPEQPTRAEAPPPARGRRQQIEFPKMQTHSKSFEAVMVGLSILCVVVVLVIVLGTDAGTLTRP